MDKPGFRDGKLYTMNNLVIIHQIICIISLIIIVGLCCCQCITHTYQYYFRRHQHVIKMVAQQSNTAPTPTESKAPTTSTKPETKNKTQKYFILNNFLTITATIASLLTVLNGTLYHSGVSIFKFDICGIEQNISTLLYHYAKMCLYYTGILRIFAAFNGSVFEYSKRFKYILVICVTVLGLVHATMLTVLGVGVKIDTSDGKYWCQYHIPLAGVFLIPILDISLNIAVLILFIKPLITLIKRTEKIDPC